MQHEQIARSMVTRLEAALDQRLVSVVLHGAVAHGDAYPAVGHAGLMIVLADLETATLARLAAPVRWWLKKDQPYPRLFSPELIRDSVDVFPLEFLDILHHHRVLAGVDPLVGIEIDDAALRLQCERELREKLMRLREGYVEAAGSKRELARLLAVSYPGFARIFRGCLHLLHAPVPAHDTDVIDAACERLDLDRALFAQAQQVAGGDASVSPELAFGRLYRVLTAAVIRIDRLLAQPEGRSP
jgi:hypothetical protein